MAPEPSYNIQRTLTRVTSQEGTINADIVSLNRAMHSSNTPHNLPLNPPSQISTVPNSSIKPYPSTLPSSVLRPRKKTGRVKEETKEGKGGEEVEVPRNEAILSVAGGLPRQWQRME